MWKKALYFVFAEIALFTFGFGLTLQFPESAPQLWYLVAALAVLLMVAVYLSDRIRDYLRPKFDGKIEGSIKFDAPEMTVSVGVRRKKKPVAILNLLRWIYMKVKGS